MKKILTCIFAFILIATSGIVFTACGKTTPVGKAYETLNNAITKIENENNNSNIFTEGEVDGVAGNLLLAYYSKDSLTYSEKYAYYNQLLVIPMNYIYEYKEDLKRVEEIPDLSGEKQKVVDEFTLSIPAWVDSVVASSTEYKSLNTIFEDGAPKDGLLKIFNNTLYSLFTTTYQVASNLAKVKEVVLDDFSSLQETSLMLKNKDIKPLRDYFVLKIANDFKNLLVESFDLYDYTGISGSNDIVAFEKFNRNAKGILTKIFSLQKISVDDLKAEEGEPIRTETSSEVVGYRNKTITKLLEVEKTFENQRMMISQAMNNFDFKVFYTNCSCSLEIYQTKQDNVAVYYDEIANYYTSYLSKYITFLVSNLKK